MKTLRQRAVLAKRPRAFAIGTVRKWTDGTFIKLGPQTWARQLSMTKHRKLTALLPDDVQERGGLVGLARSLRTGSQAQAAVAAQHAVNTMSTWDVSHPPELLPVSVALSQVMSLDKAPWWIYCARRLASFNDGMVDMGLVSNYVERAQRVHGGQLPDTVAKAYTGPMTIQEVNVAAWNQFFHEGGTFNQPAWLETNRFKELRRQFELLANMHGGKP